MESLTIPEFCARHRISRAQFYVLQNQGKAPAVFKIGTRTRISSRAAEEWLAAREAESQRGVAA
jgi:predicted DNA-binding transcriptional regulator AlpA